MEMHLGGYHYNHAGTADAKSRFNSVCCLQTTSCTYNYSSRCESCKRTLRREELEEGTQMFFTKHLFAMDDRAIQIADCFILLKGHLESKCSTPK